jgi:hypothetical protein
LATWADETSIPYGKLHFFVRRPQLAMLGIALSATKSRLILMYGVSEVLSTRANIIPCE